MKFRYMLLLFIISLGEIKAQNNTSSPLLDEHYLAYTESRRNSYTSSFVKFENDKGTFNSNLINFQNSLPNQRFKFEENAITHTDPLSQENHKEFLNQHQHNPTEQLHFSNHMRDINKNQVTFQDDNSIEGNKISFDNGIRESNYNSHYSHNNVKDHKEESTPVGSYVQNDQHANINKYQGINKIKKKRRKPKRYDYPTPQYPGLGYGLYPYGNPGHHNGQFYPPQLPPSPASIASEAINSITSALTNIALYDDYQCVSYLLCDAASGGNLPSLGSLQSVQVFTKLQPILHLLAAYNGLTFSPMYVFGRAVFLGATSKQDPSACRQAYPQCPTDPEKLVHYLNNHNGGFFRFFNAPQLSNVQGAHNIEEFYNQLYVPATNQQHGFYQPPYHPFQYQIPMPENLGLYSNPNNPQNYSPQYSHSLNVPQNYALQNSYGFYENMYNNQMNSPHKYGYHKYGLWEPGLQGYGLQYGPQNLSHYQNNQPIPEQFGLYGFKPKPNRPF